MSHASPSVEPHPVERLAEEFVARHCRCECSLPADSSKAAGASAAPLERLGDYRIIREVGRGDMAVVYEAEQVSFEALLFVNADPYKTRNSGSFCQGVLESGRNISIG
jgi:hypothetical protein